jgi:uncharacterized membrane protein YkoI
MEKITIVVGVAFAILMGTLSIGYNSTLLQTTSAQMMTDLNMTNKNMSGINGPGNMSEMKGENVTGSINIMSIFTKAIGAQVKVSLSEAATTAETNIGNGSHAVAARIGQENGYLVFGIKVIDSNMKFHKLIIDPADGKVLLSRELSPMESMMMRFGMFHHGMMKQGMMEDNKMKGW